MQFCFSPVEFFFALIEQVVAFDEFLFSGRRGRSGVCIDFCYYHHSTRRPVGDLSQTDQKRSTEISG